MTMLLVAASLLALQTAPDPCAAQAGQGHWLEIDRVPARPGTTVPMRAQRGASHYWEDEPLACTADWQVSHPEAVAIAPDRRSLRIAADAPAGTVVTISYVVAGHRLTGTLRIVGAAEVVLTGKRGQVSVEGCPGAERVGELEFRDNSRFAVTFQPFESYVDYWGSYSFDSDTGALEMKADGGNFVPGGLKLAGTAGIDGNRLVLKGIYLGGRSAPEVPAEGCTYVFG